MSASLLLRIVLVLVLAPILVGQVRKPWRWIGRPFVAVMNRTHSRVTDWGLSHVSIEKAFTILDVGCGGGRTVQKLAAAASEGLVCGIDYARGSVDASRSKNADLIRAGRVEIQQASVSHLPYPDARFDLATAVETLYYWPRPVEDLREVLRVLKPGGTLAVVAEMYAGGKSSAVEDAVMRVLSTSHLTAQGHRELLATAGYSDVQVFEVPRKGWICVTGRKPAST